MKVLFAVSNENITTSVISKYQQKYKEIVTSKNVYYFNAIKLQKVLEKIYQLFSFAQIEEQNQINY